MAQRRRTARWRKASQGPALKRCLPVLAGLALAVLALFGVGEYLGLPLPGWDEIGRFLGVYEPIYAIEQSEGAATRVHFIDAGQADATLIEQDGEFALIDAGLAENADELVAYLDAAGVDALSYLVMTHPHADHMGGMDEVLQAFRVGTLLLPTLPEETAEESWSLRALLADGRMAALSLEHPEALFTVSHAIARNKLVLALARAAFVFNNDGKRGESDMLKRGLCDWLYAFTGFPGNHALVARGAQPFRAIDAEEFHRLASRWKTSFTQQLSMFDKQ